MSDATLPSLSSASSEACPRSTPPSDPISSDCDVFPFLVHSQRSVTNGEPPEVDNGKLARQKRRRTSPEDQAMLEAEYKRNPKPDKTARLEILKKVSLGEKELQIWFQNRRQNTRRKSRPLLAHEIAAFGLGGMVTLSSDPASAISWIGSRVNNSPPSTSKLKIIGGEDDQHKLSGALQNVPTLSISGEAKEYTKGNLEKLASPAEPVTLLTDVEPSIETQHAGASNLLRSLISSQPLPTTLGYVSNRRNAPTSSLTPPTSSQTPGPTTSFNPKHPPPSSCPERFTTNDSQLSSTKVRLSLSLDGKAELVSPQISPPRPQHTQPLPSTFSISQPHLGGPTQGQRDIPIAQMRRKSLSHMPFVPKIPSGRSRDARTWEFCCDTEARDELTTQAENESSGSAVAAISLLRSTSVSNLKSNASKRNAPTGKTEFNFHGKKPKLGRASSSLARLQHTDKVLMVSQSGDSDKENWLPQDNSGNARRRNLAESRTQKQNRRRVLGESKKDVTHMPLFNGREKTRKKPANSEIEIFEDQTRRVEVDRDVDKFMRGEVSPSKKGDLDCIQGLLSLSQGIWR